jgi:hypothetical protein
MDAVHSELPEQVHSEQARQAWHSGIHQGTGTVRRRMAAFSQLTGGMAYLT